MSLAVVEAFGPTIQGEGPQSGRACSFIRFGACNLSCSWCDSAFTWDASRFPPKENITNMDPLDAVAMIPDAPMLVITGGEPLMQQKRDGWEQFLAAARSRFGFIAVETNGTIQPNGFTRSTVDQFVVSPKLPSVPMLRPKQDRTVAPGWASVPVAVDFKFVVATDQDVTHALRIAADAGIPNRRVWLMPEGTTSEVLGERWQWVCEVAAQAGVNASHRLHVLAWNDERGR